MKILLIHLSDLHLTAPEKKNSIISRYDKIVAASLVDAIDINFCFVIVSGDITYSGMKTEYEVAISFFNKIKKGLSKGLDSCPIEFLFVPGNHDCDFTENDKLRDLVIKNPDINNIDETIVNKCTDLQQNFRNFAESFSNVKTANYFEKLYKKVDFKIKGDDIQFRLINSAWLSNLHEKQGKLLFPTQLIESDSKSNRNYELIVTVFHHPYNWFESTNGRSFRSKIESFSDLILTGHEHEGDHYFKERTSGERTEYLEGGVLQDRKKPDYSLFNTITIDVEGELQQLRFHSWQDDKYITESETSWIVFQRNRYRLKHEFQLFEKFTNFLSDPGVDFSHPAKDEIRLEDLFVYPEITSLKLNAKRDLQSSFVRTQITTYVLSKQKVIFVGSERSGKTTLSKKLFNDLRNSGFISLYLSGYQIKDYKNEHLDNMEKSAYQEMYVQPSYDDFKQLPKEKKAIIIDDFQRIRLNSLGRDKILKHFGKKFKIIIILGSDELRFDELIVNRSSEYIYSQFEFCEILPFGHKKRSDLIWNWVQLGRTFTHDLTELLEYSIQLENTISSLLGRNLVPSYPIFVLIILQQLEVQTPLHTTYGSYGYLYEVLITSALSRSSKYDLDTKYSYLSELAFFLFSGRLQYISMEELGNWHEEYCELYKVTISSGDILYDFCNIYILRKEDNTVSFKYPYIYYFFVARYLSDHISENNIKNQIKKMSRKLYNNAIANIMMFLCYLSRDPFILKSVIKSSKALFEGYGECDFIKDTNFISELITRLPELELADLDSGKHRKKYLEQRDRIEGIRNEADNDDDMIIEEENDNQINDYLRINSAFKTIQIMGQILRNFPGSLKGDQKQELAHECYSLGLRMCGFLFKSIDESQEDFVTLLARYIHKSNPDLPEEKIIQSLKRLVFRLLESAAFAIVKHVSDSVGLDKLTKTYTDLLKSSTSISYRFIDTLIQMEHYRGFPKKKVLDLYSDVKKHMFPSFLLKHFVWWYFYLYPARFDLRQSICIKLGIKLPPPAIQDEGQKILKK